MSYSYSNNKLADEGYIYVTYGDTKYLKHALSSVLTLRRYDDHREVALFCSDRHIEQLEKNDLTQYFTHVFKLPIENQSITGFKHNLNRFLPFNKNLFIDSDIIWCKNPDNLWSSFSPYQFTITGNLAADIFFGSHKGFGIIKDFLLARRSRTLKRFGLSYLSRVQTGMIYISDPQLAEKVCEQSKEYFNQRHLTHFISRKEEHGRMEESCEWSMAMAMSKLNLQVFPWLNGYESPQLDFIDSFTIYDEDFNHVECLIYTNNFVYDLKGLKSKKLQSLLINIITKIPGRGDFLYATPYCLHFGWYHQKDPLNEFSDRCWNRIIRQNRSEQVSKSAI
tara:strand:+ start:70146 stop:71153 length:1008 start_codon:yes stop_codon:yes gene_type:complete